MDQATTCPYCNERPLGKRKGSRTCGDAECRRLHNNAITGQVIKAKRQKDRTYGAGTTCLTCAYCGSEFKGQLGRKFCSLACSNRSRASSAEVREVAVLPVPCRVCGVIFTPSADSVGTACSIGCDKKRRSAPRRDLQRAWAAQDAAEFFRLLRYYSSQGDGGCWNWPRLAAAGYAYQTFGGQARPLYRVALEMRLGRELGVDQAHHTCANRACVNPDHVQAVRQRENVAEMKQRNVYLARIAELESELRRLDPLNDLLARSLAT